MSSSVQPSTSLILRNIIHFPNNDTTTAEQH